MAVGDKVDLVLGTLEVTPTWSVALICTIFVLASFLLERILHTLGKWLRRHKLKALNRGLKKMKEELMLLGFISLLLNVFQNLIARICMPRSYLEHMLPCKLNDSQLEELELSTNKCASQGRVPFVSTEGLHQLHIFIFVLAVVHVCYSSLSLLFGTWKMLKWKDWEHEAGSTCFQPEKPIQEILRRNLSGFRSIHAHGSVGWRSSRLCTWIISFSRQFGRSVDKCDYLTLRQAFMKTHTPDCHFNFHHHVVELLEDDFKKIVGVSAYLWAFVIIFLLLNIHGWHTYFWISFIPLLLILAIGTKLEHIILTLGIEIAENGATNAKANSREELFWCSQPIIVLYIMHFAIFQNALELAVFFWIWATFGFTSCFMENTVFVVIRLLIGAIILVLCSYTTLPLYALVIQMGWNSEDFLKPISVHAPRQTQPGMQPGSEPTQTLEICDLGVNADNGNQMRVKVNNHTQPDMQTTSEPTQTCPMPCRLEGNADNGSELGTSENYSCTQLLVQQKSQTSKTVNPCRGIWE